MTTLARWCFAHRRAVVALWLLALFIIVALGTSAGSRFNSNFNLPHTDSQNAISLLEHNFPAASGEGDEVVFQTSGDSTIHSDSVRQTITAALDRAARVSGVENVSSPYGPSGETHIDGQAKSGRIIIAAATVMVLVFGSFLLNGSRLLQEFGFGLGFAVLIDVVVIRSLLVPSLLHLAGARNWYLPRVLERVVPNLAFESSPVTPLPDTGALNPGLTPSSPSLRQLPAMTSTLPERETP